MIFNKYNRNFHKPLLFLLIIISLISCKCSKVVARNEVNLEKTSSPTITSTFNTNCPSEGKCTIRFNKNKGLNLTNANNSIAYNLIPKEDMSVVEFVYSSKQEEAAIDGGYREMILFEIPTNTKNLELKDYDLQQTKMIYARFCNCRGRAGVFAVTKGDLELNSSTDIFNFTLQYNLGKNPPLVDKINIVNNKIN